MKITNKNSRSGRKMSHYNEITIKENGWSEITTKTIDSNRPVITEWAQITQTRKGWKYEHYNWAGHKTTGHLSNAEYEIINE